MFRRTHDQQLDMFKDVTGQLSLTAQKKLLDEHSWNQLFYQHFTSQVDESIYSVLYCKNNGRPNASIRMILGMILIKEMQGYSDEQLFDRCEFDLRHRYALGLYHLEQMPPVAATYYDFRAKVAQYLEETGEDLMAKTFTHVTAQQLSTFDISGEKIRMDSKLLQSNIVRQNRLQFILQAIGSALKSTDISALQSYLTEEQYALVQKLQNKTASNVTYHQSSAQKEQMLTDCGYIIRALIQAKYITSDSTLYKIYAEQYDNCDQDEDQDITPKLPQDIASSSVQSIHDPTAAYRKKGKAENVQTVKGFHSNITETCDQADKPNLITDVQTTPAHVSEDTFLAPAIQNTQQMLKGSQIQQVITDGGYDSINNREQMKSEDAPAWKIQKLKGAKRAYDMSYDDQGHLQVTQVKTQQACKVTWRPKIEKYSIKSPQGHNRYMTKSQVENYINCLQIIKQSTDEDYNLRANVEATIHEVFHRLGRGYKIKYRGIIKCHWYVLFRAIGVNLGRIGRHIEVFSTILTKMILTTRIKCLNLISSYLCNIKYSPRYAI